MPNTGYGYGYDSASSWGQPTQNIVIEQERQSDIVEARGRAATNIVGASGEAARGIMHEIANIVSARHGGVIDDGLGPRDGGGGRGGRDEDIIGDEDLQVSARTPWGRIAVGGVSLIIIGGLVGYIMFSGKKK